MAAHHCERVVRGSASAVRAAAVSAVLGLLIASGAAAPAKAAPTDPGSGVISLEPSADLAVKNAVGVSNGSALKSGALYPLVDDGTSFAAADDGGTLVRSKLRASSATHQTGYSAAPGGA